uniref:Cytochrome c oxidase subunit 2 n=1 Tax=Proterops sp. QL-2014 TaxID=1491724 RepID=A0A0U1WEP7_9HYME|nr:cytochrome c oxidase subunit II [Proterops sp. QL-2014]
MNTWLMMNFQDSSSYTMMMMIYFHDFIMMILLIIMIMIFYIMIWFMMNKLINTNILHNQLIEIIWTLIPMIILLFLIFPSLKILYTMENNKMNFFLTLKIMAHQWYWSYEYSDFNKLEFDSFMLKNFNHKMFRLLDVDNRLILPYNMNIRSLMSSSDVIHSWTIPSLGVKIDAIPGRLNQFIFNVMNPGLFYGQCSEICGLNHSFMPIVLESIIFKMFMNWMMN